VSLLARYLGLIKFEHTLFALPFALIALLVAADGRPATHVLLWVVVAMVGARSAAMAFNRLADRHIDAANPRTADRHLPRGAVSVGGVAALVVGGAGLLVLAAAMLNPLCLALSPVALAVVLGYSLTKRFTAASHLFLGLGLAIAPVGAWLAVTGAFAPFPLWVAVGVTFWVAGFDTIYGCQDAVFDRRAGLHSLAARWGVGAALRLSRLFHGLAVAGLALAVTRAPAELPDGGSTADLGPVSLAGVAVMAGLLAWEQALVRGGDLRRIDRAFFTINSWIGVILLGAVAIDLYVA
jgi:4-hydroxybenzoate polyprenyltransferase